MKSLSIFTLVLVALVHSIIWSILVVDVAECKIAYIIKIEGKKGAGNDLYLIGGKHCDTPTLIKKGKGKGKSKRGKIIIIEKECQSNYQHYHSYVQKIPVFVPTYQQHSSEY